MKKRIAINLLTFDSPALTGVGYFFVRLFEALPPLPNIEFIFFCQRRFELEKVICMPAGVQFRRVDVPNFWSRAARIFYEQCILPFLCRNMDVLYSPCVANPLVKINYRTITTIYDLTPFIVRNKYGLLQGIYVRTITRLLAQFSNRIITISESSKSDLVRLLSVSESRIAIVYAFVQSRDVSCVRYDPFFLTVGTRQPAKNLVGVIRSFAIFCNRYDTENHQLVVVGGKGWGRDEYSNLADSLGVGKRIIFRGYVPEDILNDLYSHCKGLILLSLYEGFGIPVIEALSWHKPSVASNVSSLPEVLGATGITVSPHDYKEAARAIKAIADDPWKYLTGAEDQLSKFSASNQVANFLQVLETDNAASKQTAACMH